jgi:hypothetical protein
MNIPKEILIKSDGNILTLKDTIKTKEGLRYQYVYSVSKNKLGQVLELDEINLTKLIKVNT